MMSGNLNSLIVSLELNYFHSFMKIRLSRPMFPKNETQTHFPNINISNNYRGRDQPDIETVNLILTTKRDEGYVGD